MKHITTLLIALACIITASTSRAALFDFYLEVDGLAGEVIVPNHNAQIAVDYFHSSSFQRGLQNTAGGTAAPSKAIVRPFSITKSVDSVSPQLLVACVTGKHFSKATLYADYRPEQGQTGPTGTFLKIMLTDVVVASTDVAADRGGAPLETVTLSFRSMAISYRPLLANGNLGSEVSGGITVNRAQLQP